MDYEKMKNSVKNIEMSDEMRARVIRNCQSKNLCKTEEITINRNKSNSWFKKSLPVTAVVSLFLCFTITAAAAENSGLFKDIINWKRDIVGAEYEQASDEIKVNVISGENEIIVCAEIINPTVVPYSELETLGIDKYKIVNMSGKVIVEENCTEHFEAVNGKAEIKIPMENISGGDYKLVITAFVGGKKADQPLPIRGTWECEFSF